MNSHRLNRRTGTIALGVLALSALARVNAGAAESPGELPEGNDQASELGLPDQPMVKPNIGPEHVTGVYRNRIAVKFRDDTSITVARSGLRTTGAAPATLAQLNELETLLATTNKHAFVRLHEDIADEEFDEQRSASEKQTGQSVPNLNRWAYLYVDVGSARELADLVNRLNTLAIVERAELSHMNTLPTVRRTPDGRTVQPDMPDPYLPWPDANGGKHASDTAERAARTLPLRPGTSATRPIAAPPLPAPGNFTGRQRYKQAAPIGIDTDFVQRTFWNAFGDNWAYTDIEYDWNQSHADLAAIGGDVLIHGTPTGGLDFRNHGTAVVGQLSSTENGFGTTGMVPGAAVRLAAAMDSGSYNLPAAISKAATQHYAGAVILIEQQAYSNIDCNGDGRTDNGDLVPSEIDHAVRDAIKFATATGRIVVAAAGNGDCNLDHPRFNGHFSRAASQDSGAIIVGAGERDTRDKAYFSTYGRRVDTHAEGDFKVTTTGYGDLYGSDGEDAFYTEVFAGTSSASPIVSGAAVALSGMLWFSNGSFYDPRELRDLLRRDGTPQRAGGHIGPRPDLRKQISHTYGRHLQQRSADFDGDGRSDYGVFRPANGTWYIRFSSDGSSINVKHGQRGDYPVAANVIGDARTELVVWRPTTGRWYVREWTGKTWSVPFGTNGDIPVPMDLDGDGRAQFAIYRPAPVQGGNVSRWYILSRDRKTTTSVDLGEFGDSPLVGDFNGDGRDDVAVFRGTTGTWYFAHAPNWTTRSVRWGAWGDIPLTYKSAGGLNIAVWRPSNSRFYSRNLKTGATANVKWGQSGDIPRLADTDANGIDEYLVWRPREGKWYNMNGGGSVPWGLKGDIPVAR